MRLRFDDYMRRCLYDPEVGFYATGTGSAGRRGGDFVTSPEVGPLFADVVARALDAWWEELGRPDPYIVVDAGTGPGALARGLRAAAGVSASARHIVGVDHDDDLPPDLAGAVVIANELLDNLPFRILERSAEGWLEVWVEAGPDGDSDREPGGRGAGWREVLAPAGPEVSALVPAGAERMAVGTRLPLLEEAGRWLADVLSRGPAIVVAFDYGAPTTAELADRGGWLRTYRRHERGDDVYREPGQWDITTDIAIDQLPPPTEAADQAWFLRRWGIDELVAEGRRYWEAHAARPDLAAIRMRSRVSEAEALLDPSGLGGWLTLLWRPDPVNPV